MRSYLPEGAGVRSSIPEGASVCSFPEGAGVRFCPEGAGVRSSLAEDHQCTLISSIGRWCAPFIPQWQDIGSFLGCS